MTAMLPSAEAVELLAKRRIYQMDDATRTQFRNKLAALVGRPPTED